MSEINMLPFYAEALSSQDFLKDDIEKIYATNRFQFYDFEKKNDAGTFFIGNQLSLEKEEVFRKLIGIFLYSDYIHDISEYEQESRILDSNIQALFKKGYKKVYNAANVYSRIHKVAKVDEIANMVFNEKTFDNYSAEDTIHIFSAILFMSIHNMHIPLIFDTLLWKSNRLLRRSSNKLISAVLQLLCGSNKAL